MTSIPAGTQFQGVIPSNGYKNKKSALLNSLSPLYTIEDIAAASGGGALTVETLTLQGTDATTTSQAIYGINVIDTATTSALATRLPAPTTGKQTTFVNNSSMSILVFPSVTGGEINGVVDGYASIPNDGHPYVFSCVENPLPGAWVWSPPATGQIQLPTISVAHTNGTATAAYGVGTAGAQLINPTGAQWYDNISVSGFPTLTFNVISGSSPGQDYWTSIPNLTPARTIVNTKVYSNFLRSDTSIPGFEPIIYRYVAYAPNQTSYNNYTASNVYLAQSSSIPSPYTPGLEVQTGILNSPVEVGDIGTVYNIQPANTVQASPSDTDLIGDGSNGLYYHTFVVSIPQFCATKTYKFDIFLEHT